MISTILPDNSNKLSNIEKRVYVAFIQGCPRSRIDACLLNEYFVLNNWTIVNNIGSADLVLAGTCGVIAFAEEMSINYLRHIRKKMAPDAMLIAFGCLAYIGRQRLTAEARAIPLQRKDIDKLDDVIGADIKISEIDDPNQVYDRLNSVCETFSRMDNLRAKIGFITNPSKNSLTCIVDHILLHSPFARVFLGPQPSDLKAGYGPFFTMRISHGCASECSYCLIRFAHGDVKSKPIDAIVKEFRKGLDVGYKAFYLVAADVGAYGKDGDTNIYYLLRELLSHKGEYKIFWDDFNPAWLIEHKEELIELLANNADRLGHVGFPVQSGSEKIVGLMKRGHSVSNFKDCMLDLRRLIKNIIISTHIIIGFPGETESDFNDSMDLLRIVDFNHILTFLYDDRPEALSSRLPGKVPHIRKVRRLWKLRREFPQA